MKDEFEFPEIICDRCNKPVDYVTSEFHGSSLVAVGVRCHGQKETIRIPENLVREASEINFRGRAFQQKSLHGGHSLDGESGGV